MARLQNRLTHAAGSTVPPGKRSDGAGLWLYKRPDGGAQWVLRYTIYSKRHEMGLGRFPDVSL